MEKLLKSACKSPSRKTQYALTTERGSRLFKIPEQLLSNTVKHFNETKSLYVFYILKYKAVVINLTTIYWIDIVDR